MARLEALRREPASALVRDGMTYTEAALMALARQDLIVQLGKEMDDAIKKAEALQAKAEREDEGEPASASEPQHYD